MKPEELKHFLKKKITAIAPREGNLAKLICQLDPLFQGLPYISNYNLFSNSIS